MTARRATSPAKAESAERDEESPRLRLKARPELPPVELGPIIKAKIQPPALRASTLSRQRLIDKLAEATTHRLTLLIAEAGYGKTTLLADFAAQSGSRTLWYRLDATDADAVTWTNHLVAAVREIDQEFGDASLRLLSQMTTGGPPKNALISSVIGELGLLPPVQTVLVLDDFHEVDENEGAVDFVARLVRDAPPWFRIVVSTRRRPSIGTGRLKVADEVREIGTEDLRFSRDETLRLFAESYGTALEDDVLDHLNQRARGWAASLQLFHGSIRGRSASAVRSLTQALSGASSPIYDFLAEEVLANLTSDLEKFLVRSSILQTISTSGALALFADLDEPPNRQVVQEWIDEADRLTLLTRSSDASEMRQLHPLLRDFLGRHLSASESEQAIRDMHRRVARTFLTSEPLVATRHFLEAGDEDAAMDCLGSSVIVTMGSGQWGLASDLINRMPQVNRHPAVAAIRGRALIEAGRYEEAGQLLREAVITESTPEVRAVLRHARISLAWRTAQRDLLYATLEEIEHDPETPPILRDIFQTFVDASPLAQNPMPLPALASRLDSMATAQRRAGHTYYAAISAHNAASIYHHAGQFRRAVAIGKQALDLFAELSFHAVEQLSTHSLLSVTYAELGERTLSHVHARNALQTGDEFVDVVAELAIVATLHGEDVQAADLRQRASLLKRQTRTDLFGDAIFEMAEALTELGRDPERAEELLANPVDLPMDVGYGIGRDVVRAQALLLAGKVDASLELLRTASHDATVRQAEPSIARLSLLEAIASHDPGAFEEASLSASRSGDLALLECADAVVMALDMVATLPPRLRRRLPPTR